MRRRAVHAFDAWCNGRTVKAFHTTPNRHAKAAPDTARVDGFQLEIVNTTTRIMIKITPREPARVA